MSELRIKLACLGMLSASILGATTAADAAVVTQSFVGAFTTPGNSGANADSNLQIGNKYVMKITYDDASPTVTRSIGGLNFPAIRLDQGANNSFRLWVPMQGYDDEVGSPPNPPYVYAQTQADHFSDPNVPPFPAVIFKPSPPPSGSNITVASPNILGLEFEGNFDGGTPTGPGGGNFAEVRLAVGTNLTNGVSTSIAQQTFSIWKGQSAVDCCTPVIHSFSPTDASAKPTNPFGVYAPAVAVNADAGPNLVYNASNLTRTTNASSVNNDIGAARSDKEDFVTYNWTRNGSTLNGSAVDGTQNGRAVSGVNRSVSIANSGLATTTSAATWQVQATEQFTDFTDTDTLSVSYQNAGPSAEAGNNLVFDANNLTRNTSGAGFNDPDLVVNSSIPNFEQVQARFAVDGTPIGANPETITTPTASTGQFVGLNRTLNLNQAGLTTTTSTNTLDLTVTDRANASSNDSANISYQNAGPTAEAGNNLVFDANNLTRNISGASYGDADLAVNASIANFEQVTVNFGVDGNNALGSGTPQAPVSPSNPITGTLGIAQAGLATTLSTNTLDLLVTDRAGATATDTAAISYLNAAPVIDNASATPLGLDIQFDLDFSDADLAVNVLIPGFEQLAVQILVDNVLSNAFFSDLINTGSQFVSQLNLLNEFGAGVHGFEVRVADRVLASLGQFVNNRFQFEVQQTTVPEPATGALFAVGLAGLRLRLRQRRQTAIASTHKHP